MGAEIEGVGSEHITVHGKPSLQGAKHQIVPDRIETGTYAAAVAICGGRVELTGTRIDLIESVVDKLRAAGCSVDETPRGMTIARNGSRLRRESGRASGRDKVGQDV